MMVLPSSTLCIYPEIPVHWKSYLVDITPYLIGGHTNAFVRNGQGTFLLINDNLYADIAQFSCSFSQTG